MFSGRFPVHCTSKKNVAAFFTIALGSHGCGFWWAQPFQRVFLCTVVEFCLTWTLWYLHENFQKTFHCYSLVAVLLYVCWVGHISAISGTTSVFFLNLASFGCMFVFVANIRWVWRYNCKKKKKKKPWRFFYLTETQVQCDHFTQNKQWKYHTPARNFCFVEKFSPRDSDLLKLQLRKLTSFAVYIHLGRASSAAWCTRSHVPVRAVVVIVGQTLIKAFWCDGLECWLASLAHGRLYSLTNRCVLCFLGTRFHSGPSNLDAWRWYLGLDWELLTSRMRQQWSIGHRPARK